MRVIFFLLFLTNTVFSQSPSSIGMMANSFFDDGKAGAALTKLQGTSNITVGLVDDETGEQVSFKKITTFDDGSAMNNSKVDGVVYRKKGNEYFRRVFSGPVNVQWFGAKGDARTDATKAIQKAIDLYDNVYIPRGQYQVSGLVISKSRFTLFGDGRDATILYALGKQDYVLAIKNLKDQGKMYENVHVSDLKVDGAHRSKVGLYCSIVSSLIERLNVYSCTEYGILHFRGFTSTYRDCYVSYCDIAGLNVYQEGNLLLFDACLFSNNEGSGVIFNSGSASIFLKCSIENNKNYGVLLTWQPDKLFNNAPYVQTATGLITFMTCFFETNGMSNPKRYANITFAGQPDPGLAKVFNVIVKGCHFGLNTNETALDFQSDIRNVTIEDNLFAYFARKGTPPITIGSFYSASAKARIESHLSFKNNIIDKSLFTITGASAEFTKNAIADLLSTVQKTTIIANGLTFSFYKTGKMVIVYINGTSLNKMEQNINLSSTGILVSTDEKMILSNYNPNGFLFETSSAGEDNTIRFGCSPSKTFNNQLITFPTSY